MPSNSKHVKQTCDIGHVNSNGFDTHDPGSYLDPVAVIFQHLLLHHGYNAMYGSRVIHKYDRFNLDRLNRPLQSMEMASLQKLMNSFRTFCHSLSKDDLFISYNQSRRLIDDVKRIFRSLEEALLRHSLSDADCVYEVNCNSARSGSIFHTIVWTTRSKQLGEKLAIALVALGRTDMVQ